MYIALLNYEILNLKLKSILIKRHIFINYTLIYYNSVFGRLLIHDLI